MATQFVENVAVEIDGEGDPVVMIHGLGGTSNTWSPLAAAFVRNKRVRLDLPGSGRSHRVAGPLSIARFVEATMRAMAAAAVQRAHVVAHSMGTIVAAHLAATQPGMVRSLALFAPLLAPPESARRNIRVRGQKVRVEGAPGMQAVADTLVLSSTSSQTRALRPAAVAFVRESLMRQDAEGYARTCEALADAQPADLSRIGCPTLLVTGNEDAIAPPQAVRLMGGNIAGSRVEILSGCGHWTPLEKPEECVGLLQRFYLQGI